MTNAGARLILTGRVPVLLGHVEVASSNGNTVTSGSLVTYRANLLVASVADQSGTPSVFSDSLGNVWVGLTIRSTASGSANRLYYCFNPIVGLAQTFTATGTSVFAALAVGAFRVPRIFSPANQQSGATTEGATALATGAVTTLLENQLVVAGMGIQANSSAYAIDSSFTITGSALDGAGASYGVALAYRVVPVRVAVNPSWSYSPSSYCAANAVAF